MEFGASQSNPVWCLCPGHFVLVIMLTRPELRTASPLFSNSTSGRSSFSTVFCVATLRTRWRSRTGAVAVINLKQLDFRAQQSSTKSKRGKTPRLRLAKSLEVDVLSTRSFRRPAFNCPRTAPALTTTSAGCCNDCHRLLVAAVDSSSTLMLLWGEVATATWLSGAGFDPPISIQYSCPARVTRETPIDV